MATNKAYSNQQALKALTVALARFLAATDEHTPELGNVVNHARELAHRLERDVLTEVT